VLVAFDIDNVLCDIIASAKRILAKDADIPVDEVILTNVYHRPFDHAVPEIAIRMRVDHAFWDREDLLSSCPAMPGAVEAVNRLHDHGMLAAYVTRRPASVRSVTEPWMRAMGFPMVPIYHVGTTDAQTTYEVCKSTVCHRIGATHLVDDHATEIATAKAAGIEVIVVDADIGRDRRMELLAENPGVMVARDAAHAVEMLIDRIAA
jgi:beta-phosphoglucomutase-like phosphatase (HAD superfamily)